MGLSLYSLLPYAIAITDFNHRRENSHLINTSGMRTISTVQKLRCMVYALGVIASIP